MEALEGLELLAQGRHRTQRRRRLGGADGVLHEIAKSIGRAGHPYQSSTHNVADG